MRVEKPLTHALERGAGVQTGTLDSFIGKPTAELAAFIEVLPDESPLKPFVALLGTAVTTAGDGAGAVSEKPSEEKVPTSWMVKQGDNFVRLDSPPELGTEIYRGGFQKKVTPGGYDMRGERNADRVKWIPGPNVRVEIYDGAGDPNVRRFGLDEGSFMVKRNGHFMVTTRPPDIGTEVFTGTFQKRVTPGGYDMRGERNADKVSWVPGGDVQAQPYDAAGELEEF